MDHVTSGRRSGNTSSFVRHTSREDEGGEEEEEDEEEEEERISAACQIKEIFERHPDWDRTSRKLNKSFDHWNTRSWSGCTKTSIVNLGRCWGMGANAAKVVLRRHNLYSEEEVDFEGISGDGDGDGDIDLMRPNGVLVGHSEVEQ